ncbi:hypothetical protein HSR121_2423 [Halapricum desulfuricans]|uniref:Uncharacterized protein n=1 Tax=Halapricum desulfuricans TaxID=2841257 RepID=A0A897N248_9EURY|nr:hypothetical protein HSR121_2423 [Halapricum desulfuricans]
MEDVNDRSFLPDQNGPDVRPPCTMLSPSLYWWLYVRKGIWYDGVPDQFEMV